MAAAASPALTRRAWSDQALQQLEPSVAASPWGPLASPQDAFSDAHLWEFTHGRSHALIAIRPVSLARGRRLEIVGIRSDGDRMPNLAIQGALEQLARDYQAHLLAFATQRPHILRRAVDAGWLLTGGIAVKAVQ